MSTGPLALWAGVECTFNRVGDVYFDQCRFSGHDDRPEDLDLLADLGIKTLRYPVLWERHAPHALDACDFSWADDRLARLRARGVRPIAGLVHHGSGPRYTSLDDPAFPGGCYHPSADWLRSHGHNPDKAGGIEFGNARNFLSWSREQPSMVLHEFAHAYHHRILGYDNPSIQSAFKNARDNHLYDNVLRASGRTEKAYALNNDQEYFAESSEAFFGTNDFYPFVRPELERHDPTMAKALKSLWGVKGR